MSRALKLYLKDILAAIERIEALIDKLSFEDFCNDRLKTEAVLYNFIIVGEATRLIPKTIRDQYSNIPWAGIVGLRDIVTHEYFRVNLELVWDIIQNKLPGLRETVNQILLDEEKS